MLRLLRSLFSYCMEKKIISKALDDILVERVKQDEKWGEQNHNPYIYLTILVEEVGELGQAILQSQFGGKHGGLESVRHEAVQAAAVAMAIVECLDRNKWVDNDVDLITLKADIAYNNITKEKK